MGEAVEKWVAIVEAEDEILLMVLQNRAMRILPMHTVKLSVNTIRHVKE